LELGVLKAFPWPGLIFTQFDVKIIFARAGCLPSAVPGLPGAVRKVPPSGRLPAQAAGSGETRRRGLLPGRQPFTSRSRQEDPVANAAVAQGQGLLDALGCLTAFEADDIEQVMASARDPFAFAGVLVLASKLAAEVDRLGGDSGALRERIYVRASGLACSS
jgi:hypothetical protein